jgi:hypothetical protein
VTSIDTHDAEREYTAAAAQALRGIDGDAALSALGWWDLLPHLDDRDARVAAFALFRAQGDALASSAALGGLIAQPFADALGFTAGTAVSTLRRTSPRRGEVHVVVGDVGTRHVLVDRPGSGVALLEADSLVLRAIDVAGGLTMHELALDVASLPTVLPESAAALLRAPAVAYGRVAIALEMLGAAEACVALAVEYAGQREQFGHPIGTFQAVRHLLAWARTDCVAIEAVAARAVALGNAMPARLDDAVKALAGRNGRKACERALQVFGGIGFTAEHPHHHFHGRVLALDALLGTSAELTAALGAWLRTDQADPRFASTMLLGG